MMDDKRQQVIEFIYDFLDLKQDRRFSHIVLNHECGIDGDEAIDLIYGCGELLGISDQELEKFPFDVYFNSEDMSLKYILLLPFIILMTVLSLIFLVLFYVFKVVGYWLFRIEIKIPFVFYDNGKPSLTVAQFADIMIDLGENAQQDTKDVFGY